VYIGNDAKHRAALCQWRLTRWPAPFRNACGPRNAHDDCN
jgi:hypothetical protein